CKRSTSTCTWMGCCKIDRSRRSLNVEIGVLGVFAFYRLREMELWFASSPPYAARDVQAKDDKNPKARLVGDRRALRHSTPAPVRGSSRLVPPKVWTYPVSPGALCNKRRKTLRFLKSGPTAIWSIFSGQIIRSEVTLVPALPARPKQCR